MLRSLLELEGYILEATDGQIGKVKDFYFNDRVWAMIYLVVDTGNWLPGRKVLLNRGSLGSPDWEKKKFPVKHSKEFIRKSPSVASDKPVSRQKELSLISYFKWKPYLDQFFNPPAVEPLGPSWSNRDETGIPLGNHLCSFNKLRGYRVECPDCSVGEISDFIINDSNWSLAMLIVELYTGKISRKISMSSECFVELCHDRKALRVNVDSDQVLGAADFDYNKPATREWVVQVYDYNGRPIDTERSMFQWEND